MPWARLDDRLPMNPKMAQLSDAAFRLWTHGLAYAAGNRTDGQLTPADLPLVWPTASSTKRNKAAAELVKAGRWYETADGWEIHDYLEMNPSADEVEATVAVKSQAGSYGNHKRWHVKRNRPDPDCEWCDSHDRSHMRSHKGSQTNRRPRSTQIDPDQDADPSGLGENGKGGVRGGSAEFNRTLRAVAEEHADRREAEGYTIRNREAFIADLVKSPEVRNDAMKRMTIPVNVHKLIDRIGSPIDPKWGLGT